MNRLVAMAAVVGRLLMGTGPAYAPAGAPGHFAAVAQGVPRGHQIDPSYFEPGSCVSFRPTSASRGLTVFLDAGHGGIDPGAVGDTESGHTIFEADETLPMELDTMALLRARGFTVTVSRTRASTVARPRPGDVSGGAFTVRGSHRDVTARDLCANLVKADVLIGIYLNAGPSPFNAGCLTAYDAVRPFAAKSIRLARLVQDDVLSSMNSHGWGIPDAGVVSDGTLGGPALSAAAAAYRHLALIGPADPGYVPHPSQMPGVIVEPLFITDPFEATIAASKVGQEAIAKGLAQAIEQYFGP